MTRLAEAIQRAAQDAVVQLSASWLMATVTAVNGDGTLNITTAAGPVPSVRRLRHYTASIGDKVMVAVNADGNWIVVGATAP
ncbi:hypothetical protein ABZ128_09590 [Streptomyces sp. NPDC006326]|uniref:hypothetical protein n=1 Tax=Streptomyces sp. NPDC006326 TaxID=3156752 RepID=UPI0033BC6F8B